MVIGRGQIWWADLPAPVGSGPGFRRPVLIVQSDSFNRSRIGTTVALSLTTNLRLAEASGNVLLPRRATGLPKDSVANVSQLMTIDKGLLSKRAGELPAALLKKVDAGLRWVLDIP